MPTFQNEKEKSVQGAECLGEALNTPMRDWNGEGCPFGDKNVVFFYDSDTRKIALESRIS